jgi:hypothetical protein
VQLGNVLRKENTEGQLILIYVKQYKHSNGRETHSSKHAKTLRSPNFIKKKNPISKAAAAVTV